MHCTAVMWLAEWITEWFSRCTGVINKVVSECVFTIFQKFIFHSFSGSWIPAATWWCHIFFFPFLFFLHSLYLSLILYFSLCLISVFHFLVFNFYSGQLSYLIFPFRSHLPFFTSHFLYSFFLCPLYLFFVCSFYFSCILSLILPFSIYFFLFSLPAFLTFSLFLFLNVLLPFSFFFYSFSLLPSILSFCYSCILSHTSPSLPSFFQFLIIITIFTCLEVHTWQCITWVHFAVGLSSQNS